jgi:hypothetical protein
MMMAAHFFLSERELAREIPSYSLPRLNRARAESSGNKPGH